MTITKNFRDNQGIMRRVLLSSDSDDPVEGIPISLALDQVYPDMPAAFVARLTDELWARGLVEAADYKRPGAPELARAAVQAAARHDAMTIITFAHQSMQARKEYR